MNIQTVRRWLSNCLPLRFISCNPFFDNTELLLKHDESLCEKYDIHIRCIRGGRSMTTKFTCSVDVDNTVSDELAKEYGVRTATINSWKDVDVLWSIWHEYSEQFYQF